jgi:hypothetical protein
MAHLQARSLSQRRDTVVRSRNQLAKAAFSAEADAARLGSHRTPERPGRQTKSVHGLSTGSPLLPSLPALPAESVRQIRLGSHLQPLGDAPQSHPAFPPPADRIWIAGVVTTPSSPFRLDPDGFLFSADCQSANKAEITNRVAANFVGWEKDHTLFDRELEKVIRALRTGEGGREKPPPEGPQPPGTTAATSRPGRRSRG